MTAFVDDTYSKDDNVFTVLVGKNGTGKSRLLSSVVNQLIDSKSNKFYSQLEIGFENIREGTLEVVRRPSKVIAISTSPFDKFPVRKYREDFEANYTYIGLRDLSSINFGQALISRIIEELLELLIKRPKEFLKISSVLAYLGFSEQIVFSYEIRRLKITSDVFRSLSDSKTVVIELLRNHLGPINRAYFRNDNDEVSMERLWRVFEVQEKLKLFRNVSNHKFKADQNGLQSELLQVISFEDFKLLIESGLARLRDVSLKKHDSPALFRLNEASSGEQCVIITILGIACHIKDDSLICIDEPEISLHPEWQERYIQLLISTFKEYKRCQFLIASHSPQLVAKLNSENCYILLMDSNELKRAKEFVNKSIDFQLAHIFNSPGFQNEYLNRIAFTIMAKVSRSKGFDIDDLKNYQILESQANFLEKNDPILGLLQIIKQMKAEYA